VQPLHPGRAESASSSDSRKRKEFLVHVMCVSVCIVCNLNDHDGRTLAKDLLASLSYELERLRGRQSSNGKPLQFNVVLVSSSSLAGHCV
jgi:hypothetical protein